MSHEFDELKDCPFCGNKSGRNQVETIRWTNTAATLHRNKSQVICRNCNATAGAHLNSGDAVRAWNQRSYDYDMPAIVKKVQRMEAALKIFADPESWNDKGYSFYTEFPFVKGDPIQLAKEALGESCKQPE